MGERVKKKKSAQAERAGPLGLVEPHSCRHSAFLPRYLPLGPASSTQPTDSKDFF